jgi:hypothetical protein
LQGKCDYENKLIIAQAIWKGAIQPTLTSLVVNLFSKLGS